VDFGAPEPAIRVRYGVFAVYSKINLRLKL